MDKELYRLEKNFKDKKYYRSIEYLKFAIKFHGLVFAETEFYTICRKNEVGMYEYLSVKPRNSLKWNSFTGCPVTLKKTLYIKEK